MKQASLIKISIPFCEWAYGLLLMLRKLCDVFYAGDKYFVYAFEEVVRMSSSYSEVLQIEDWGVICRDKHRVEEWGDRFIDAGVGRGVLTRISTPPYCTVLFRISLQEREERIVEYAAQHHHQFATEDLIPWLEKCAERFYCLLMEGGPP